MALAERRSSYRLVIFALILVGLLMLVYLPSSFTGAGVPPAPCPPLSYEPDRYRILPEDCPACAEAPPCERVESAHSTECHCPDLKPLQCPPQESCPVPEPCPAAPEPEFTANELPTVATRAAVKHPWQWEMVIEHHLSAWPKGTVTQEMIDWAAEERVERAGVAFRIQIRNNHLFVEDVRALWFLRDYTPSRIVMLLETLKRHNVPDLEAVFNSGDYPVLPLPRGPDHMRRLYRDMRPPPVFSPTGSASSLDIPWPDFSWMPPPGIHELKTPRWPQASANILQAAAKYSFDKKIPMAAFTGNMQAPPRELLAATAASNPDLMFVNEVFFKAAAGKVNCIEAGLAAKGGHQKDKCGMNFEDLCRFKYLVNVGSNGYANKNKYLFLCKSVVLFVRDGNPNYEFFEQQFLPGIHYYLVRTSEDVPAAVRALESDPALARSIAEAGTTRMAQLDLDEIARYTSQLLRRYSTTLDYTPQPREHMVEVNCEDDLYRHYNRDGHLLQWIAQDNSTCIHPPPKGEKLRGPGWGGAYNNSGIRCTVANDMKHAPHICDDDHRHPGDLPG